MPQAWSTRTPYSSANASISMRGQAEPPTTRRFTVSSRVPLERRCCNRPSQTVGTPAEIVTRSAFISSRSEAPSRCRPGITSVAPAIGAAYGVPQALTWNIGTTGSMRSVARIPSTSGMLTPIGVQAASSGGCTARPSAGPSCPMCSKATRRCVRRTPARRSPRRPPPSDLRSRAGPCPAGSGTSGMCARAVMNTTARTDARTCGRHRFNQRGERRSAKIDAVSASLTM